MKRKETRGITPMRKDAHGTSLECGTPILGRARRVVDGCLMTAHFALIY